MPRAFLLLALLLAGCGSAPPAASHHAPTAAREPQPPCADLPIANEALAAAPSREPFRPSRHGFRFVNRFEGSPLPGPLRDSPLASGRPVPNTFGLCGGMSLLAADYFLAGLTPPQDTAPPAQGTPLHEQIFTRQVESLGDAGVMVLAFREWMHLPDDDTSARAGEPSASSRTRDELPAILERLDRGELVPLGLVLVRAPGNERAPRSRPGAFWHNHQVLAYAAERRADATIIRIYDPNYPGDDDTILHLSHDAIERRATTGRPTRVRGVFPMPYAFKDPGR
jgi:hypothetical protein